MLPVWNLPSVFWAWTNYPFGPNGSLDFKFFDIENCFSGCFGICCTSKWNTCLVYQGIKYRKESAGIRLLPNLQSLAVTQRLGKAWNPIFIPKFDRFATDSNDLLLCPCWCLKTCRKKTKKSKWSSDIKRILIGQ